MIFLFSSIVCSTLLLLIFKYFEKFKLDTFQAIVCNYISAALFGFMLDNNFSVSLLVHANWIFAAACLGILFISVFFIMAQTAQRAGVSVASVANKMSLVIPVIVAFLFLDEKPGWYKILGIIFALIGVVLATWKDNENNSKTSTIVLPLLLFFGSGIIDTGINLSRLYFSNQSGFSLFTPAIFASAAIIGIVVFLYQLIFKSKKLHLPSIFGGVLLGICNFYSIYFLIKTLQVPNWESTIVFPINNMGVVIFSTMLSGILFREKISALNRLGIAFALLAIVLIAFQEF